MKKLKYDNDVEIEIVSSIFKKSGIDCVPKIPVNIQQIKTDIDVLAVYKNVVILVECVGGGKFGDKLNESITVFNTIEQNFDAFLDAIKNETFFKNNKTGLCSNNKIIRRLLVSFVRETKNDIDNQHNGLAKDNQILIWTREEQYYYDKISDCTYDHCKYEIFDYLNIKPEEVDRDSTKSISEQYLAWGKRVGNGYILNLIIPVKTLLERSSIKRLHDTSEEEGYQRLLDKGKLKRMREYLLKEKHPYPNNLICVLNDNATIKEIGKSISDFKLNQEEKAKENLSIQELKEKLFIVEFPNIYDIFEIIDGQHRLFSFAQTKYSQFEKPKDSAEMKKFKEGDDEIQKISSEIALIVTAVYSRNDEWGEPGKLFLEINTTQTRIKAEDFIDLLGKYYKNDSIVSANNLLLKLNDNGILKDKIKTKFWQTERIKRTSLISHSGLKEIFDPDKKSHNIFKIAFNKQNKLVDYSDFCFILINNFLYSIANLVKQKNPKKFNEIEKDLTLKEYYLFSAVFIGALIRLLRHFISEESRTLKISNKINKKIKIQNRQNTININMVNQDLQDLFSKGLEVIAKKLTFTKEEFKSNGWASNTWAQIEAHLFYLIKKKYKGFGDETLISSKHRKPS